MRWTFCKSFLFRCRTTATPPLLKITAGVQSCRWDSTPPWLSLFNSSSLTGTVSSMSLYVVALLLVSGLFFFFKYPLSHTPWCLLCSSCCFHSYNFKRPSGDMFSVAIIRLNGVCLCLRLGLQMSSVCWCSCGALREMNAVSSPCSAPTATLCCSCGSVLTPSSS